MPGKISQDYFGKTKDGREIKRFTLSNSSGSLVVRVIEFGAVITEIHVPDRDGKTADVTLAYDDVQGCEAGETYFGAVVGRLNNVTVGAAFTLDGQTYTLSANRLTHTLHGGTEGFDKKVWSAKVDGDKLVMTYVSPDGEEGFPGEVTTTVTYTVTDDNALNIQYAATTTKPTAVALTNHAYFNLGGHDCGTIADHYMTISADGYIPADNDDVPSGEIHKVEGTLYDLRTSTHLGERLPKVPGRGGICTNYCLTPNNGELRFAVRVEHPPSGRHMECWTTEPGVQLYCGSRMDEPNGKGGSVYGYMGAFCLEAQRYPNCANQTSFLNPFLRPGETYRQTTIYKFGAA